MNRKIDIDEYFRKAIDKLTRREKFFQLLESICIVLFITFIGIAIAGVIIKTNNFNKKIAHYDECVQINQKEYCRIEDK